MNRTLRAITPLTVVAVTLSIVGLMATLAQPQGSVESPGANQTKRKKLKEIAAERDVEVPGGVHSQAEYSTLEELTKNAVAIVYGRVIESKSFFDESGHPVEHGERITTEYTIDVYRVLKDVKLNAPLQPGQPAPAPLSTPLKIARDGGIVHVNGHRAEVKYKGYESLNQGNQYLFFLFWSPDYQAYTLAGGISGVVAVNQDSSLSPLASSEDIKSKLRGVNLENFITQVGSSR
jgi:hypothetical protein